MAITGRERGPQPAVVNDRRLSDFHPPQLSVLQPPLTTVRGVRRAGPAARRSSRESPSRTGTRRQDWLGPAIHPGELLLEEYLKPLGVGQVEASKQLGVSLNRLNEIVLGKRGITADTALRLGRFLKTSPQLWMRLQADWDLYQAMAREGRKVS